MFLKLLSPRTPSSLPSPYSIFIAQCFTSSPSLLTDSHAHSHPDSRKVQVTVWWDLDKCTVPLGVNTFGVARGIAAAIKDSGIKGPIQIKAFGDKYRLSRTNEFALTQTGVTLAHVPRGVDYSALRRDLEDWVLKNPPPSHLFLITVDEGLTSFLHRLRINNYNIVLASKESAPAVLRNAVNISWNWNSLVRGGKGLLEDPSTTTMEQPVQNMNWCNKSFWRNMKITIKTDIGSFILAESRTRGNMAYYLQEYGPSVLRSVMKSDVLLMVDILMVKKLVHETPFATKPFKRPEEVEKKYADAGDLEEKIDELNSKVYRLQKRNDELTSQKRETELALKVAEVSCIQPAVCLRKKKGSQARSVQSSNG